MFEINVDKFEDDIPIIDSNINYWFVRSNGGDYYTDFNINNYVGIGYNRITFQDIADMNNSTEALKTKIQEIYSAEDKEGELSQPGKIAGQLLRFTNRIVVNDIVVVPSESSQMLLVGVVSGRPYELSDAQLEEQERTSNYKKSDFKKRIPVRWIGSFDRDKADSALYKMIFSQQTLADINSYKQYINRALFPVYVEDGVLHLTFNVTSTESVNGKYLGQFIYFYTSIYELLFPGESMDIRVNVQSPGPIESISKNVTKGLFTFAVIATILSAPYGGSFKIGSDLVGTVELTVPGLFSGKTDLEIKKADLKTKDLENDKKRLENIEEAINLAVKLKVPVAELGIELPQNIEDDIQKEVDRRIEEESGEPKKENPQTEDPQVLDNGDSNEGSNDADSNS